MKTIIKTIFASFFIFYPILVLAHELGFEHHHMMNMNSWFGFGLGWIVMILFWILIILAAVLGWLWNQFNKE